MEKQPNIFTTNEDKFDDENIDNDSVGKIERVVNQGQNKKFNNNLKINYSLWFSVSEAAKIGGVQNKTIRRAIQSNSIKFKIIKNRYLIELTSLIIFLHTKTKLKNKLNQFGIGQYIKEWK
ncbi:MAG: hypothetical protein PHT51_03085 [Patescibacteria group bacterium]|nr:hypothetical protein [Patescibacteria group bacterium]